MDATSPTVRAPKGTRLGLMRHSTSHHPPAQVEQCIMGNVVGAGLGQAPARQAALAGGLHPNTVCTTVNKVCSSGIKAITMAAQAIAMGDATCVVAGGMESMSNIPFYLPRGARAGMRMGHQTLLDGMLFDGLWCPSGGTHMGSIAEACAREMGISREDQDAHAFESYTRAARAQAEGALSREIVPVRVESRGASSWVERDEALKSVDLAALGALRPAFEKGGTVTAGNSSTIADGAAALVLMTGEMAQSLGIPALARVVSYADAEQAPELYPTTPALAGAYDDRVPRNRNPPPPQLGYTAPTPRRPLRRRGAGKPEGPWSARRCRAAARAALARSGLEPSQVDAWELNEAFSVVDLANRRLLCVDGAKVNINGGAVALGHPIGASGTRLVGSLSMELARRASSSRVHVGVASICNGGGGASAIVLESAN
mmetsp:Transcript_49864/g.159432  ORF Transcript_49864/g.159432 Transcript_49864/m.159432 type:complete len:430 (+) Transcript_49864:387-1676(+)